MREKHGMTRTPEYQAWRDIRSRCYRPKNLEYHNYGGRGIKMHDSWRNSFSAFFSYVGCRPPGDMSIDRIDPDGNYEPGNVRWASRTTQNRNFSDCRSPLGIRGVRFIRGRYYAYIHVERAQIALGGFDNFFDAVCSRKSAEIKYWSAGFSSIDRRGVSK